MIFETPFIVETLAEYQSGFLVAKKSRYYLLFVCNFPKKLGFQNAQKVLQIRICTSYLRNELE